MASNLIQKSGLMRKGVVGRQHISAANFLLPECLSRTQHSATSSVIHQRKSTAQCGSSRQCKYRSYSSIGCSPLNPLEQRRRLAKPTSITDVPTRSMSGCSQHFDNESEYHTVADESLEDIQDAVEMAIEDNDIGGDGSTEEEPEVVYASGVLTMSFPPHGTWVLNKQTPNRQIWWSSPISGPKRYEYDPETSEWVFTRGSGSGDKKETLTGAITDEIRQIYDIELDL